MLKLNANLPILRCSLSCIYEQIGQHTLQIIADCVQGRYVF